MPSAHEPPARPPAGYTKAPLGLKIRVFIYLVAVHGIVAFFFLIFQLAGAKQ
jgi:hypothetical protein